MTYEDVAKFAQMWGLLYFGALSLGVLVYVFRPRNKRKLDEAARLPLDEDE